MLYNYTIVEIFVKKQIIIFMHCSIKTNDGYLLSRKYITYNMKVYTVNLQIVRAFNVCELAIRKKA